jgi:uncharacterized circularly permuted ATP-grasp superfamily protein
MGNAEERRHGLSLRPHVETLSNSVWRTSKVVLKDKHAVVAVLKLRSVTYAWYDGASTFQRFIPTRVMPRESNALLISD